MSDQMPEYLHVPASALGASTTVKVVISGGASEMAQAMADDMFQEIVAAKQRGRFPTFIVPVGPVDQFPLLAQRINDERLDCRNLMFINMDEYLTDSDQWIALDHPLSFRGYMQRLFYDRLKPGLAPFPENRVFPDPRDPVAIPRTIAQRGGVDACFGGIGINGHIAFNEPPEADPMPSVEEFAALPTRVLNLTRETRTINSVTVGGEISIIPRRSVTVGMNECLGAAKLRFYCNRPWQASVVRRVLHGPITPACPASLLRRHPDASITLADYVAAPPDIRLR